MNNTVRVAIVEGAPFVIKYEKNGKDMYKGSMYEVWVLIKEELKRNGYNNIEEHHLEDMSSKDARELLTTGKYDIVINNLSVNNSVPGINFTRPLMLNKYAISYKAEGANRFVSFFKILFKYFIPPLLLLLVISIILGLVLYRYSPRHSKYLSIWQTISGLLGESGYLSEYLSDNIKKTKFSSFLTVFIIMLVSFYFGLYLQASVTQGIIQTTEPKELTREELNGQKVLVYKNTTNSNFLNNYGVKQVEIDRSKNIVEEYLANTGSYFGYFRDYETLKYDQEQHPQLEISKANLGFDELAWGINQTRYDLLKKVNETILKLQKSGQILHICVTYMGNDSYLCEL